MSTRHFLVFLVFLTTSVFSVIGCRAKGPVEKCLPDGISEPAKVAGRACDEGDSVACDMLADLLLNGQAGLKDFQASAIPTFLKACDDGYGSGCSMLLAFIKKLAIAGSMTELVGGTPETAEKIEVFLNQSCGVNQNDACLTLALLYASRTLQPKTNKRPPIDMLVDACKGGAVAACDRIVPKEKGLFVRSDDQFVPLNMILENKLLRWDGGIAEDGFIDKAMLSIDFRRAAVQMQPGAILVLAKDPTDPLMISLLALQGNILAKPRRCLDPFHWNMCTWKDAIDFTYAGDEVQCLSSEQLNDSTLLIKVNCAPGTYFVRRGHPEGVHDWYYPLIVTGEPQRSHCGDESHCPASVDATAWKKFTCQNQEDAGNQSGRCVSRSAYSDTPGAGCPGRTMCCPAP